MMEKIKNILKNKKFSIIYALTFFVYPVMLFGNWSYYLGDYVCVAIAALLSVYMLAYIIFLRKKENVGLGRSISQFFLYALISLNTFPVMWFAIDFINGYQETAWFTGETIGERYYGWEAITQDEITQFIFGITFPVLAVYLIGYIAIGRILKKKQK